MKKLLFAITLISLLALPIAADAVTWSIDPSGILFSWNPNQEPDVAGYEVYRADAADGAYSLQHAGLVTDVAFLDADVAEGESKWYKLTCVDACGNVSGFSPVSDEAIWDITKPILVGGFEAQINGCSGEVLLTWLPHTDQFLKTFHLSSSPSPDGPFTEIYAGTELSWSDVPGTGPAYYQIRAEDEACWLSDPASLMVDVPATDVEPPVPPVW